MIANVSGALEKPSGLGSCGLSRRGSVVCLSLSVLSLKRAVVQPKGRKQATNGAEAAARNEYGPCLARDRGPLGREQGVGGDARCC